MGQNIKTDQEIVSLSNYTKGQRLLESFCLFVFFVLTIILFSRLIQNVAWAYSWTILVGAVLGLIAADFVSGLVHWAADTWGTAQWPIVGPSLIRSFREHHVDQTAITHHDFVETNGASSMVCIPVVAGALFIPLNEDSPWATFVTTSILFFSFFILLTNQIHKWSHSKQVPRMVGWFQRYGLILSPTHHRIHHGAPYDRYYCITTGWLNPILSTARFFRTLEYIINKVTGAIPRDDDQRLINIRQGKQHEQQKRSETSHL